MDTLKVRFRKDRFNFLLPRILDSIATLDENKDYVLTVANDKRSNDANSYYWTLIGKLAEKIGIPPKDIYRTHIKDVGGNYEVVPIRDDAVETWIKNWQGKGIGWVSESIGQSKLRGYTNVICFYGSSTYDTRQMSRLIDLCIQDCKAQGIETMTPNQLAALIQ
jgi:hypothetical protein